MSLYSDIFYAKDINELFSDERTVEQLLRVEAVLARAQAENGIIPRSAAKVIQTICSTNCIDLEKIKKDILLSGNTAIPLIKQLTEQIKDFDEDASKYVHLGATSQDIIDTATVLQIQTFFYWLESYLKQLEDRLILLTCLHRNTFMIGRTLLQQAKPITFGLKTALWLEGIGRTVERLKGIKKRLLVIQLSGAVGSQNWS